MFENDYTISGIHATHLKYLVTEAKIFKRYIDVYMIAAIFGYLHGRLEKRDSASSDRARIYADAFATERITCDYLFRLIMLLDNTSPVGDQQRLDRAFRNDTLDDKTEHGANMELFNAYVLGGIEVLYETLSSGATNTDDYINKIYDMIVKFKEQIDGINFDDKLQELIK